MDNNGPGVNNDGITNGARPGDGITDSNGPGNDRWAGIDEHNGTQTVP